MLIEEVYSRFAIPENLQTHMLRVTGVALLISDNWKNKPPDKQVLIKAGLLHDLANVVKFTLEPGSEAFLMQRQLISKYGSDDHQATEKMLREINTPQNIINIIQNKSLSNAVEISESDDWILKLLFYADMRVAPGGVVSLDERLKDVVARLEKYRNHPKLYELLAAAGNVERQIQDQVNISLGDIDDKLISDNRFDLLKTKV